MPPVKNMDAGSSDLPQPWSPWKSLSRFGGGGVLGHDGTASSAPPKWIKSEEFGDVLMSRTSEAIFCLRIEFDGGGELVELGRAPIPEEDPISCFTAEVTGGDEVITLSAHRSTLIRLWKGVSLTPTASFRAHHSAPIAHLSLSPRSGLVYSAASGADFTVRAWDLNALSCVRVVRGLPARPTAVRTFSAASSSGEEEREFFAVGSVEGQMSVGSSSAAVAGLSHFSHHKSPVVDVKSSGDCLVSLGKDNVLAVYEIRQGAADVLEFVRIVPIFEEANSLSFIPLGFFLTEESHGEEEGEGDALPVLATAGAAGTLAFWDVRKNRKLKPREEVSTLALPGLPVDDVHVVNKKLFVVQEDILLSLSLSRKRSSKKKGKKRSPPVVLSLNFSQVTDADLVGGRYLVISHGTRLVKCYDLCGDDDDSEDELGRRLCVASAEGEDVVLIKACQAGTNRFATSGRGAVITVWEAVLEEGAGTRLVSRSTLKGHASTVTAIHFSGEDVVTADKDGVMKLWKIFRGGEARGSTDAVSFSAIVTIRAHDKEITCLSGLAGADASSSLVLSGSQDKTAKLWVPSSSVLVATLRGHRRAVTCATFSAHEDMVATGSSDLTVRLWGTRTFECFKTLEGLSSWPTAVAFVDARNLAISTHAGILHVANTPTDKLESYDRHGCAIWGLCVFGKKLITLSEEGEVVFWADNSARIAELKLKQKEESLGQDQMLSNCLQCGNMKKALNLALHLDRPQVTLRLLCEAYEEEKLEETLGTVRERNLSRLLDYVRKWNTKTRLTEVVQETQKFLLTRHVLRLVDEDREGETPLEGLDGLKAFDEKHLSRVSALVDRMAIVDALLEGR